MATPTVFVSSTFYDLRWVREGISRFIASLGYLPVLSEEGTVFYDPTKDAASSCLAEVGNANLFVLVIGGRYGSLMPDGMSVTNAEYQAALKHKIPVFALVEQGTYNDFQVFRANAADPDVLAKISFPNADSVEIFHFIQDLQGQVVNNALVPFRDVADIEDYLRNQWAGMLHAFLATRAEEAKVADSLEMLNQVNVRIELLAEQILKRVGTPLDRVAVALLQEMMPTDVVDDMRFIHALPAPIDILEHESLQDCAAALGKTFAPEYRDDWSIDGSGGISHDRFEARAAEYVDLRDRMLSILEHHQVTLDEFREYSRTSPADR